MYLFLKKIFGFASLFAGEEHEVHVLGKEEINFLTEKKILIRLMFIFNFF